MILGKGHETGQEIAGTIHRSTTGWSLAGVGAQTMIAMTLAQAATAMSGDLRDATDDIVLDTVVTDSREAGPGALFIAVVGRPTTVTITSPRHWVQVCRGGRQPSGARSAHPGRRHRCRGRRLARAVIDRCEDLQVVALTGSSGKTSTRTC